ncbi:MAG: Dabb family protein [Verrucomicrobiales bacterium]|nr:Dabb family protein [Verrucomicrobiales bacterium]
MIEHTVTFTLKHPQNSDAEHDFLTAAGELAAIPGVCDFAIRRQISEKHPHSFGITMRFESPEAYDTYLADPIHTAFVKQRWMKDVDAFQEADFAPLDFVR